MLKSNVATNKSQLNNLKGKISELENLLVELKKEDKKETL